MKKDRRPLKLHHLTIRELEELAYAEIEELARKYTAKRRRSANTKPKKEKKDG